MVRLAAIWIVLVSLFILLIILREEQMALQGKVPLGRLRRLWFGAERRSAPRYRVDWPVRYQRVGIPPPFSSKTRDLSHTGVGLILEERLEVGSPLELELTLPGESNPLSLRGQVVWMREVPGSFQTQEGKRRFFVGIQFHPMDPQKETKLASALKKR